MSTSSARPLSQRASNQSYSGAVMSGMYHHRCTSTSTTKTIVPDVTTVNEDGKRVGMIFGGTKRFSLLMAMGLGEYAASSTAGLGIARSSEAASPETIDSDHQNFVVDGLSDASSRSPGTTRTATTGYPNLDVRMKRLSATLSETTHKPEVSNRVHEVPAGVKRGRVFQSGKSRSPSKRDTVLDAFTLGGKVVPISRAGGPHQDILDRLCKVTKPRPGSVLADRPKSGENVREFLFDYQASCIKTPTFKPLRLRGTTRPAEKLQPEPVVAELNSSANTVASNLSELFNTVEALCSDSLAPSTPPSSSGDLILDAFVLNGRLVPVSRTGGPRQDTSANIVQKPDRASPEQSTSSKRHAMLVEAGTAETPSQPFGFGRNFGSQDTIIPSMFANSMDSLATISSGSGIESSVFEDDSDEDVDSEDEDEDRRDPFEYDGLMDPISQSPARFEQPTVMLVDAFRCDVDEDEDEDEDNSDPFEFDYVIGYNMSQTSSISTSDDDGSYLFDHVFASTGLLISPGLTSSSSPSSRESTPPLTPTCPDLLVSGSYTTSPDFVQSVDKSGAIGTAY